MSLEKDTVAIPFVSGIQPSTPGRLLEPQKLLTAQNCSFILEGGPVKRNGHESHTIKTDQAYPGLGGISLPTPAAVRDSYATRDPGLSVSWLYGWGIRGTEFAQTTGPFETSPQPTVGQTFGGATRDQEILAWDGHRIFSYAPSQTSNFGQSQFGSAANATRGPSCIPMMNADIIAKIAGSQSYPDAADNGTLRVATWINSDALSIGYSVYDATNKACLVSNQRVVLQSAKSVRIVPVGTWFHILVSDSTANSLEMRSFQNDTPSTVISRSFGGVDQQFDVKKISESRFVVIRSKAGVITMTLHNMDGSVITSVTPGLGGFPASTNLALACEVDLNGNVGIAWNSSGAPNRTVMGVFNQSGATIAAPISVTIFTTARRLTLAPRFIGPSTNATNPYWDVYVEDVVGGIAQISVFTVSPGVSSTLSITRFRVVLATHAFRVGNRSFVWLGSWLNGSLGLQNTWFLVDASLAPVGTMAYGQANVDIGSSINILTSVNWHTDTDAHPYKDRIVYHGALGFNLRVASSNLSPVPNGVFAESSIKFYKLDFLHSLRASQAGRTTYIAGAQLWAYDGEEAVESGFLMAPEAVSGVNSAGGSLSAGVYRYRVDLCHKSAQNEEIRSWSIVTAPITAALNDKITLTIPGMPMTRRENAYFLIFRTQANGTLYNLVNSRDPSSPNFLLNALTSATFSYVDTLADTSAAAREYHPANAGGNYLDPLPPPACEIAAAGRDRLWLSGGELAIGEVAPSRLFSPGQAPAFTPALNIQVDRNAEPISALGFVGEIAAVFRRTSTYVIDSDGPDNSLNGTWASPRLAIADTGAISQEGIGLTTIGLWFQSPAGIRLMGSSGQMDPTAGTDVNPVAIGASFAATVVVPQYTQIRWYSRDITKPAIVLDYSTNAWSLWTGLTASYAAFWSISNLAVILRQDGYVWVEKAGIGSDNGDPFEMIVRTSWLRGAQLGDFQRVRRFALFGNAAFPQNIRVRLYYDERPFWDEEMTVILPEPNSDDDQTLFNNSVWGGNPILMDPEWGSSQWGDGLVVQGDAIYFRDQVFRFRRRPARQKCSVFSVEFSDLGTTGPGFEPVVLALELGRKKGLDRIPTNT